MNRFKDISKYRKSFDIVTNSIHYPIASYICTILSYTKITPNGITSLAILAELLAIYLIMFDFVNYAIPIVILLQFGWIFDLMDGMMARYKKIGYYDSVKSSNKGYYLDAVSDHVLKFVIIGALGYELSKNHEFGWEIAILSLIIHGIVQTEHTLRKMITNVQDHTHQTIPKNDFINHIVLLMNNIYLFYLIFIPINRIDLLLIIFVGFETILLFKRIILFWISEK